MSSLTLKILDILKGEFSDQQARKIAETIETTISEAKKEEVFVTKDQLNNTEKSIMTELAAIRLDIAAVKQDMAVIKSIMVTKDELQSSKFDTLKWVMVLFTINIITIVGAIIGVAKFVK